MDISKEKLEAFEKAMLDGGGHDNYEDGVCAMELVSYIANEPFSATPQCVCPALTSYVVELNDILDFTDRQLLKPYLLKLLGTRDDKGCERAEIFAHAALTIFAPFALAKGGHSSAVDPMRALKLGDWKQARDMATAAYTLTEDERGTGVNRVITNALSAVRCSPYQGRHYSSLYSTHVAGYAGKAFSHCYYTLSCYLNVSKEDKKWLLDQALETLQKAIDV